MQTLVLVGLSVVSGAPAQSVQVQAQGVAAQKGQLAAAVPRLCAAALNPASYAPGKQWTMLAGQGKGGWLFSAANLRPFNPSLDPVQKDIQRFRAALAARGTELITVTVPPRAASMAQDLDPQVPAMRAYNVAAETRNYAAYVKALGALGLYSPNALALAQQSAGQFDFFFARDHHWTPQGAATVAGALAAYIRSRPAGKTLNRVPYRLNAQPLEVAGSYAKLAAQVCGGRWPAQKVTTYTAQPVKSVGLLDEQTPQVVLVGTSQSNTGALAESLTYDLQTPVLNASIDAGGARSALETYLHTPDFRRTPPRFLIWELEDTLLQYDFYPQLIPAVRGACAAPTQPLFFLGGAAKVRLPTRPSLGDFLAVTLPDLSVRSLRLSYTLAGRVVATSVGERALAAPNDGVFYFELPVGMRYDTLTITSGWSGQGRAQLCRG